MAPAIGAHVTAIGQNTSAMGYFVTANSPYLMALGSYASTNGQWGAFVYGDPSTSSPTQATRAYEFAARGLRRFPFLHRVRSERLRLSRGNPIDMPGE